MSRSPSRYRVSVPQDLRPARLSGAVLRRYVVAALERIPAERADVRVRVVGDAAIARWNRQFLGRPRPTNVLSFPDEERAGAGRKPVSGNIVVSAPTCLAQTHGCKVREILVAGGVSANTALRAAFIEQDEFTVHIPKLAWCTDNAAMIASAGYYRYAFGHRFPGYGCPADLASFLIMIKSEVLVPLLNANEPEARLVGIHVKDGQRVEKGTLLFTLETTKAAADVESLDYGFVHVLVQEGGLFSVGDRLAVITETVEESIESVQKRTGPHSETGFEPSELRITKPARDLAGKLGVDLSTLPTDQLIS